jgi:hypothetical protein
MIKLFIVHKHNYKQIVSTLVWTPVQARAEQENRATGTETKTACSAVLPQSYNHRPGSGNGFGKRWRMPVRERRSVDTIRKILQGKYESWDFQDLISLLNSFFGKTARARAEEGSAIKLALAPYMSKDGSLRKAKKAEKRYKKRAAAAVVEIYVIILSANEMLYKAMSNSELRVLMQQTVGYALKNLNFVSQKE